MQTMQLVKEMDKLKNDPQYIDFFCKMMKQKLGEDKEIIGNIIDEGILYYKDSSQVVYGKLLILKMAFCIFYGKPNEAITIGKENATLLEEVKQPMILAKVCYLYAVCYREKGLFEEAIHYSKKALEKINKDQEQVFYIENLMNIAQIYMEAEEYKKAINVLNYIQSMKKWLTESLQFQLEMGFFKVYLKEKQEEKATWHCQNAYGLVAKYEGDDAHCWKLGLVLIYRAQLNALRKLKMQAEKDFNTAYSLVQPSKRLLIEVLVAWGLYLLDEGEAQKAEEKISSAFEMAKEMDSNTCLAKSYSALAQVYKCKEEWEAAYKTLEKAQHYKKVLSCDKLELWVEALEEDELQKEVQHYEKQYEKLAQIAQIGYAFTTKVTADNVQEIIQKEISNLMNVEIVGIAMVDREQLEYKVFDANEKWLDAKNNLVKYTVRLADYCTQYQTDIIINDGNFEEYSLKQITNSTTEIPLQSVIVMPLRAENRVIGAMVLGSYQPGVYNEKDKHIARILASYLGMTLKNTSLYHKINYMAEHDNLTGLLSRRVALKNGEQLFKENHKRHKSTAIMMLDTDLFKQVNNKYGHQLGDEVLKKIGKIIKENVRAEDYVGRYGGEEFIVILNDIDKKEVVHIAEKIKTELETATFETKKEKHIKVTLSGGIYICNEYTLNFADAIRFADHALYRAKLLGRNRIMSYSMSDGKF